MPLKILIAAATGALLIVSTQAVAGPYSTQHLQPGQTRVNCSDAVTVGHPGLKGAAWKAEYAKCMNDPQNYK